jgi:hypothetical protein
MRAAAVLLPVGLPVWLLLVACTGGGVDGGGPGGAGSDTPIDAPGSGGPPMWADAATGSGGDVNCKQPATPPDSGHHNAGMDCEQGCHNHGFTISGTVYTGATNNTAYAGATVTIVDAQNRTIDIVTRANGNFYTSQAVSFPIKIHTSSCPYGVDMAATAASGRCNMSGCHAAAVLGKQIHLP